MELLWAFCLAARSEKKNHPKAALARWPNAGNNNFSIKFVAPARVAELVDALVSNTNGSNTVPVRLRPRVRTIRCHYL